MKTSEDYAKGIRGPVPLVRFETLQQQSREKAPDFRVSDFMVLGPFVLETDGLFETEYFYERHKILDVDYLASSGGEADQVPYLRKAVRNDYYGKPFLQWQQGVNRWNMLRFDDEESPLHDALYQTEQRNCVYYAAVYVTCAEAADAILCYENSGSKLFLNGVQIDSRPYGRINGLPARGHAVAVHFQAGTNLLLFKLRTGFIADTIDISMTNCAIYPLAVRAGHIGVSCLQPTAVHTGSRAAPRQVFQGFAGAFADSGPAVVAVTAGDHPKTFHLEPLSAGSCRPLRIEVPVRENEPAVIRIDLREGPEKQQAQIRAATLASSRYNGTEHVFSSFHFDTTYHQEQRVYALGALHITRRMLEKLAQDPDYKVILSEVDYLHPYYAIYPEHRQTLRRGFQEGRIEADCFYNQPNELTSAPEGLVRNLAYGQLYHRDVLDRLVTVYAPGDVFGHPNQLSQLCARGGCTAVRWGKLVLGLDTVFRHMSPDGTVLLHDKGTHKEDALRLGLDHCASDAPLIATVPSYPLDEPVAWMKKTVNRARYSVLSEMLAGMNEAVRQAGSDQAAIDLTARDLTQHHSGVLLTRTDFKQANRLAENLLITAEKFAAVAAWLGADYPEKALDKAWRQILCAQHHDSITGTNNEVSFVDLMIEYREAVELAADIVKRTLAYIASGIRLDSGRQAYCIFNPHGWDRADACRIELPAGQDPETCRLQDTEGNRHPLQLMPSGAEARDGQAVFLARVPAMGYAVYYLENACAAASVQRGSAESIENEYYRITVDPDQGGGIVSLYDKQADREVLRQDGSGPANRVVILREVPDRMETQHELYTTGHQLLSSAYPATVASEKGAVFEQLVVTASLGTVARLHQTITLYHGVKRIDLQTVVADYQDRDDLFTVTFPVHVAGGKPVYDDRFAPHVGAQGQKQLSFQTHQYASFSHSRIFPANQWLELGPTIRVAFENDTVMQGEINIGMTALIRKKQPATLACAEALLQALARKAIPVTPYPDVRQQGGQKVVHFNEDLDHTDTRFVLCLTGDGNAYAEKILADCQPDAAAAFRQQLHHHQSAILFTRDSDNRYQKPIDVILIEAADPDALQFAVAEITGQLATGETLVLRGAVLASSLAGVDRYGVALLNRGTICCSVEPDNLMNLMLFHTADFYGNSGRTTGGHQLVPEQKTHVFQYALYPHEGDYREAKVYQQGFSFNDPLLCAPPAQQQEKAFLPTRKSFVRSSDDWLITAFKAGGYPLASLKAKPDTLRQRGFTLRGFEPHGRNGQADITFGFDLASVARVDLLEEGNDPVRHETQSISLAVTAHAIETLRLEPGQSPGLLSRQALGASREPVEPTYVRSWEYDLGSMPMGYLSVAGTISRAIERIDATRCRLMVSMVNNHPDQAVQGVMTLQLPAGFAADQTSFPYDIEAGGHTTWPVMVTKPCEDAPGVLRLHYRHDGQLFEDLFPFGNVNPDVNLAIEGDSLVVTLYNPASEVLQGEIAVASPFETWSASGLNQHAWGDLAPRTRGFSLQAGESGRFPFTMRKRETGQHNAFWAVVKVMANGRIHFAYARDKGPRHVIWAHEFFKQIQQDNGSLDKLLRL